MNQPKIEIVDAYIRLLNEGTDVVRPVQLIDLQDGTFRILATPDYDPKEEEWEFLPTSVVAIKDSIIGGEMVRLITDLPDQN
jgi:hypothetical protein